MKKITITALLLLSSALYSEMFDHNTDVKSKYKFDMTVDQENEELASRLEKFQSGEASEEEIKIYLEAKDNNKTAPFKEDVFVDESLKIGIKEEVEKGWFSSLFDTFFTSEEEAVVEQNSSVEELTPEVKEETPVAEEVVPATIPEKLPVVEEGIPVSQEEAPAVQEEPSVVDETPTAEVKPEQGVE